MECISCLSYMNVFQLHAAFDNEFEYGRVPTLVPASYVNMGRLLNLSGPQFSHLIRTLIKVLKWSIVARREGKGKRNGNYLKSS